MDRYGDFVMRLDQVERRLKLRELRILLATARTGSMAKAAVELGISQPNVSKAISDLEHTFGVRLLDRGSHGVEPTAYGVALIKRGIAVFDELRYAVKDVAFLADPTSGELRIGCSDFAASTVGVAIDRISRRHPRITFEVVSASAITLQGELKRRNIEGFVAIFEESLNKDDFEAELLYDDPLVVVADIHHRLARRRSIKLAELVNEPWALPPANTPSGSYVRTAFEQNGLSVPHRLVNTYSHVLRHHLVATAGFITVLPKSMLEVMAKSLSLQALSVDIPEARRTMAIVILKQRTLSPVAKLFIETVRAVAKPQARSKTKSTASTAVER
jgi:DNA-binding transcriptional LysR family regulator